MEKVREEWRKMKKDGEGCGRMEKDGEVEKVVEGWRRIKMDGEEWRSGEGSRRMEKDE